MWGAVIATERDHPGEGAGEPLPATGSVANAAVGDPVAFGDIVAATGAQHVVVVIPAALAEPARSALTLTCGRWPDLRIAWLISDHVPLALHAALVAALLRVDEPGLAPSYVRAFADASWSGAWTSSVAGLGRPAPSVGHYLRSFLPGSHFLLSCAPHAQVRTRASTDVFGHVELPRVLLTGESGIPQVLAQQLVECSGAVSVRPYGFAGHWDGVIQLRAATQLALVPADPRSIEVTAVARCHACGTRIASAVCPYCHVVAERPDRRRAAHNLGVAAGAPAGSVRVEGAA